MNRSTYTRLHRIGSVWCSRCVVPSRHANCDAPYHRAMSASARTHFSRAANIVFRFSTPPGPRMPIGLDNKGKMFIDDALVIYCKFCLIERHRSYCIGCGRCQNAISEASCAESGNDLDSNRTSAGLGAVGMCFFLFTFFSLCTCYVHAHLHSEQTTIFQFDGGNEASANGI